MTRGQFLFYYETYCGSDINNITQIIVDNHNPIYVNDYLNKPNKGISLIDVPVMVDGTATGEHITGFLLYGLVASSAAKYPGERTEWLILAEDIQGIGRVVEAEPAYAGVTEG